MSAHPREPVGSSRDTERVLDSMVTQKNDDTHLRLASRNDSVVGEELGKDITGGLDSKGKCGYTGGTANEYDLVRELTCQHLDAVSIKQAYALHQFPPFSHPHPL